jgi:hypothetical protein
MVIRKTKNREFGQPISIKCDENMEVDLDHILCIKNYVFGKNALKMHSIMVVDG